MRLCRRHARRCLHWHREREAEREAERASLEDGRSSRLRSRWRLRDGWIGRRRGSGLGLLGLELLDEALVAQRTRELGRVVGRKLRHGADFWSDILCT